MERLKDYVYDGTGAVDIYLHSSMERLKGTCCGSQVCAAGRFTFQYGEIKSDDLSML